MSNIHTPERQPGESQANYRLRQRKSRAAVRRMTLAGLGNQRKMPSQREQLRNIQRENGAFEAGSYGKAIMAYIAKKQRERIEARRAAAK